MAREKVQPVSQASEIRAVSTPVDTYVRPADPAPSGLHGLADSLSRMDRGLKSFMDKRKQKQDEADGIRGEAAFHQNNSVGWDEAVKSGAVPAHSSPIFMQSWKKQQGNLEGMRLKEKFNSAWLGWDGRDKGDPAAFDQFVTSFLGENLKTEDEDILRGLMPHVTDIVNGSYNSHIEESGKRAYSESVRTSGAIGNEIMGEASRKGIETGEGTDYESVWSGLMDHRNEVLGSGIKHEDFDETMVDTIIAKAIEEGDPQLLNLLDKKLPGSDTKLSDMPDIQKKKMAAISDLEVMANKRMTAQDKEQKDLDKKAEDTIVKNVQRALSEDINTEVPEEVVMEWERYDPQARTKLAEFRKKLIDGGATENPRELLEIYRDISGNPAEAHKMIERAVELGIIKTHTEFKKAQDYAEQLTKDKESKGGGILGDSTSKRILSAIKTRTTEDTTLDLFGTGGMSDDGLQASQDFEMMLMDWKQRNPDASLMEQQKAINDLGQTILGRIDEDRQYQSEQEALKAQEQQPQGATGTPQDGQQPQDAQTQPDGAPTALPEAPVAPKQAGVTREEAQADPELQNLTGIRPPQWEELSDAQQQQIDATVAKTGKSREEVTMKLWEKVSGWLAGNEAAPGSPEASKKDNTLAQGIDDTITNSIEQSKQSPVGTVSTSDDPVVRQSSPILSLLGRSEGTDKGAGYNETLSYGAFTGGPVQLTRMTLDEVDKLQTRMLAHPKNNWNSSAAGRYQIVRKTLRVLRKDLGLTGSEMYDEAMQDKLATALLKKRGLDKWVAGKMSDKQFMNNLAMEWASVPQANGKGYYSGQNAGVKVRDVLDAFKGVRSGGIMTSPNMTGDATTSRIVSPAYLGLPQKGTNGEDQHAQFMEWNPDPIGNHEKNLDTINMDLAKVVRLAEKKSKVKLVVGSGIRTKEMQKKAVQWGWSKTEDSDHLDGSSVDLWPVDEKGRVNFNKANQTEVIKAMKEAAKELGITLDVGGDWKSWKDMPHFAIKKAVKK